MRSKFKFIIAIIIIVTGFGGLLAYDFYLTPYVFSSSVIKVSVEQDVLPKNYVLTADDVYVDQVATGDIPKEALRQAEQVVGLRLNVDVTDGQILTRYMLDMANEDPGDGEGILPVPRQAIYAINGSLRNRDKIDIYLFSEQQISEVEVLESDRDHPSSPLFENVHVVHVRTDDNNDVRDSEFGDINKRMTSTGRVTSIEVKMPKEHIAEVKQRIEAGYKLWIVRVE